MYDLVCGFKNNLNDVVLLCDQHSNQEEFGAISTTILELTRNLDRKLEFYTKKIYFERVLIVEDLIYNLELFTGVLLENNILFSIKLDLSQDKKFNAAKSKELFYALIDLLIHLGSNHTQGDLVVSASNYRQGDNIFVVFEFQTALDIENEDFESLLQGIQNRSDLFIIGGTKEKIWIKI